MAIVAFVVVGCEETHHTAGSEIDAIYWHEGTRYTAMTNNADVISTHRIPPFHPVTARSVNVYADVAEDESSWYECDWTRNNWTGTDTTTAYCDIHIHSIDELGTADWNHGKFGSGSTTRIE